MPSVEVSKILVRSPPELWTELEGAGLVGAVGPVMVHCTEPERELAWKADGASGTARLEPAGWGTRVVLTAEVEPDGREPRGLLGRFRRRPPAPMPPVDLERRSARCSTNWEATAAGRSPATEPARRQPAR